MKDIYEVLGQKEAHLARVRHEIASLRIAASLLLDDFTSDDPAKKRESSSEKPFDDGSKPEATGTDGLLSSDPASRPRLWNLLRGRK